MQHQHAESGPRPLTRTDKSGVPYRREPAVEQQLRAALALAPADLVARARISEKGAPEYLQEEALVYLIREAQLNGALGLVDDLTRCLIARCGRFITARVHSLGADDVDDARGDVYAELFSRILDPNTDRGDFLQVRFWLALQRLIATIFTGRTTTLAREREMASFDAPARDDKPDEGLMRYVPKRGLSVEEHVLCMDALNAIRDPRHRAAFALRHHLHWPIENDDPDGPSVSRRLQRDPRTIRNWLTAARADLDAWDAERPAVTQGASRHE